MARIEHAAAAVVLLVAFVADLRFVVPVVGVLLLVHAAMTRSRVGAVEAALLGVSSVCFLLGSEVAAWALALLAAALCGVVVARPGRAVGASRSY